MQYRANQDETKCPACGFTLSAEDFARKPTWESIRGYVFELAVQHKKARQRRELHEDSEPPLTNTRGPHYRERMGLAKGI